MPSLCTLLCPAMTLGNQTQPNVISQELILAVVTELKNRERQR